MTSVAVCAPARSTATAWAAAGLFVLALGVRLLASAVLPLHPDEPYHILPARSWLTDGSFRLFEGEYTRVRLYTILVAASIQVFGDSAVAARLPAALSGAALVPLAFLWTRSQAGPLAGSISALLLCFAELAVQVSAFTRFYALQAVCFWLAATIVFRVTSAGDKRWSPWALAPAGALLALALYLQKTTIVGLLAVAGWVAIDQGWRLRRRLARSWVIAAMAAGACVAAGLLIASPLNDVIQAFAADFRGAEFWATTHQDDLGFYHRELSQGFPILWVLFPAACVIAWLKVPRAALFCALITLTVFGLMSLAGMKTARYIFFVYPFMLSVWGIALAAVAGPLWRQALAAGARILRRAGLEANRRRERALAGTILAACMGVALLAQPSYFFTFVSLPRTAAAFAAQPERYLPYPQQMPWRDPFVVQTVEQASIVLTSNDLQAVLFLGGYDVLISRDNLEQTRARKEFAPDFRTGRPVVSSARSIRELISCHRDGVVLVAGYDWRNPHRVPDEVADELVRNATITRVSWTPENLGANRGWSDSDLLVARWRNSAPLEASCASLRAQLARRTASP